MAGAPAMTYTRLGASGLSVSRLWLGCMSYGRPTARWPWALDEAASRPFLKRALDLGINTFDTADVYTDGASEEVLGRALKDYVRREEVVVATKVYNPTGPGRNERGLSRKHVLAAIDASLERLGTDYVDLYQIHRFDPQVPVEETLQALHDVVRAGKARYLGASSMHAWQFSKLQYTARLHGWTPFVSMQPQYNLLYREEEREMLPLCRDLGVGVVPWSPLARGYLAGGRGADGGPTLRARTDEFGRTLYGAPADAEIVARLAALAARRGVSNMQLALAWVLSRPGVTAPIVGVTKPEQLDAALAALAVTLDAAEAAELEAPYRPRAIAGFR